MPTTRLDGHHPPRAGVAPRAATVVDRPGLAATLAELVRERVRVEGLDPQTEPQAVRGIADRVVQAHDQRSLTGAVDPLNDAAGLVDELVARVSGYGPLQRYLDDATIEEIWINDPALISWGQPTPPRYGGPPDPSVRRRETVAPQL